VCVTVLHCKIKDSVLGLQYCFVIDASRTRASICCKILKKILINQLCKAKSLCSLSDEEVVFKMNSLPAKGVQKILVLGRMCNKKRNNRRLSGHIDV